MASDEHSHSAAVTNGRLVRQGAASKDALPRTLGLWSSIALVIGITIGSGIFRSPAAVARHVASPAGMIGIWMAGGVITLCGALSFAALASAFPVTGGFYAYLREGWGRGTAFVFGWTQLLVLRGSAIGGISIVFAEYALRTFGLDPATHVVATRGLAAAAIAFAAAINVLGTVLGALIVNVSTAAKFLALGLLISAALLFGGAPDGVLQQNSSSISGGFTASWSLALVSVLWAYDGFADLVFTAGEVKNPQRNLPLAIIGGTVVIVVVYSLANLGYLHVLPLERIRESPLVAADAMTIVFGGSGARMVSSLVTVSAFSAVNGIMLATPRVFFAMAEDGLIFTPLARVHARFRTPHVAIILTAVLGALLVLSQTFETLSNTFVLAIWPFYALSVAVLYRLPAPDPAIESRRRALGFPVVPAIFITAVVWFLVNALITEPISTGLTFAIILAGLPVYVWRFRR